MIGEYQVHSTNAGRTSIEELPNVRRSDVAETVQTFEGGNGDFGDNRIAESPRLTEAETHKLLVEWNATHLDYRSHCCLHELFEAQVEQTPDAVAASCQGKHWTYRELNARANQVAHRLRDLGVGCDTLVAICMERSLEMVAGILGILKSGGAYVPLDPRYPRDRLAFMLEDSQASVLLTQAGPVAEELPHRAAVVRMDGDWDVIMGHNDANPPPIAKPDNLAYVIYTSGSTGRPKGVAIEHRGVVSFVEWSRLAISDRLVAATVFSTSICFDVSVLELFVTLCRGGKLILIRDILHLEHVSPEDGATFISAPPSAMLAALKYAPIPKSMRAIGFGGEALPQALVDQCYEQDGIEDVFNFYGPTETTVYSLFARADGKKLGQPSIGRPIANTQVYVLDQQQNLVPVGVTGELYIGGIGLARGYLNRPELTAERFIENPFHGTPGTRLYKTGDLVRWLPDGNLEFLGRIDHQVKIRGHRIELGEIETALGQHPSVQEAVVVAREDVPGEKRLAAYIVPREGQELSLNDLRGHLQRMLPEPMVPAAFVCLEKMPLTANGKLNRQALPSPEAGRMETGRVYEPPRTPTEAMLAELWSTLLHLERVGIQDHFFELGGDSLLAARMLNDAQKGTNVPLPLATIFQAPTIAALAKRIESAMPTGFDLVEAVRATGEKATIVWVGNGRAVTYLQELLPPEHALYWCRLEHFDGRRLRHTTVEDLARQYCHQLWAAGVRGPCVVGGHSFAGIVAFEVARQFSQLQQDCDLFLVEPTLPGTAIRGGMAESVRSRIARHRRDIVSSAPREALRHTLKAAQSFYRFTVKWSKLVYCRGRLALGLEVPIRMRWPYVEAKYDRAALEYTARPFFGRLVVVQGAAGPEGAQAFWPPLAQGGFAFHTIHCNDHFDVVEDRSPVLQWIDLLKNNLAHRSQGNGTSWN